MVGASEEKERGTGGLGLGIGDMFRGYSTAKEDSHNSPHRQYEYEA